MKTNRYNFGFTLIELMVVVIIIAALAGMVVPRLWLAKDEAKRDIAKGDLASLSVALRWYHLKNDRFPTTEEGLKALYPDYLEKKATDPWKRDYQYKYPGVHNTTGFDLWSQGADPQGEGDDVTNWRD
jgi:general secretion pathway protein G